MFLFQVSVANYILNNSRIQDTAVLIFEKSDVVIVADIKSDKHNCQSDLNSRRDYKRKCVFHNSIKSQHGSIILIRTNRF